MLRDEEGRKQWAFSCVCFLSNLSLLLCVCVGLTCFRFDCREDQPAPGGCELPENGERGRRPARHVLFTHFPVHFHLCSALTWVSAVPRMSLPLFSFHCRARESIANTKNTKGKGDAAEVVHISGALNTDAVWARLRLTDWLSEIFKSGVQSLRRMASLL